MSQDNEAFKDGVASGANELAQRLLIMSQWGITLDKGVIEQVGVALIKEAGGEVRGIHDAPATKELPEGEPPTYNIDETFGDDL